MFARRILFLGILILTLSMLAFLMLPSVQAAQTTDFADRTSPSCRRCPGGGGGQLTQAEIDSLKYMREEEKLARDAYLTLYAKWYLTIFSNIADSEVAHMSRVKDLLDRYGLPDPAAGQPVGVFTNPVLQQLYDDLIAQGDRSPTEALKVGVAIEEVDIQDLKYYLSMTNKTDISQVYTNLMNASYNHLNAFNHQLDQ